MSQTEYIGEGKISILGEILDKLDAKKLFLFTGRKSFESSGASDSVNKLGSEISITRYIVTDNIPEVKGVEKASAIFKKSGCTAIAAIGGGNVIDTAKLVNAVSSQQGSAEDLISGNSDLKKCMYSLIAVPTTAGSGSEATQFAVAYSCGVKFSVTHPSILPAFAIVDPELTYSLDGFNTAVSGIDAMCQSIESMWACGSDEKSTACASDALKLTLKSFLTAVNNPDEVSRRDMSVAANLAGKAINISKTTAPHALSYSLTSDYGIPHGQAVCVTLPAMMEFNYEAIDEDCTDARGVSHLRNRIEMIAHLTGTDSVNAAAERLRVIMRKAGLKTSLKELGIPESKLNELALNANAERLGNNPRRLTTEEILQILKKVY